MIKDDLINKVRLAWCIHFEQSPCVLAATFTLYHDRGSCSQIEGTPRPSSTAYVIPVSILRALFQE